MSWQYVKSSRAASTVHMGVLFFWGDSYSFIIPYTGVCSVVQSTGSSLEITSKLQFDDHRDLVMMERPKTFSKIFQLLYALLNLK